MGGPSAEHDVSLKTAAMIIKHLDKGKFSHIPVKIERDGSWPITISELKNRADVAFIAMHGAYGEDGGIQTILATHGIRYTGSDPVASAMAMDKEKSMEILKNHKIRVPDYYIVSKKDSLLSWKNTKKMRLPAIVKPVNSGSSLGISVIHGWKELGKAMEEAFKFSDSAIIQKYTIGKEVTCGVLQVNGNPIPLMPTEILPGKEQHFGYESKYAAGGAQEFTPPNLPGEIIKLIQLTALDAHRALGCSGMSRTDMIIDNDNRINVLELNTIPGLTETSLLPQGAKALGIHFPKLLEHIISLAIERRSIKL